MTFTPSDLAAMRATQEAHMQDTCVILVHSRTYDTFGASVDIYTDGTLTKCGLDPRPGSERHTPDAAIIRYDATLRLPITVTLAPTDRVRITTRYGEDIAPIVYDIAAPIQRGPSGIRVLLRRVET